ncbi:hypothetical protein BD770DRAFT_409667 [Pilaira anomala]|nr:hypothetical protein BD770DRAFT_409667 [Pilaira anomala]
MYFECLLGNGITVVLPQQQQEELPKIDNQLKKANKPKALKNIFRLVENHRAQVEEEEAIVRIYLYKISGQRKLKTSPMLHKVATESIYQAWLKCAADLQPQYDYFNSADLVMKSKQTTSTLYVTTLNKAILTSFKKEKPSITDAIALFNKRNNQNSLFYKEYNEYWARRDEDEREESGRRIEKRVYSTLEDVAEDLFSSITQASKRVHRITGLQIIFLDDNGVQSILEEEFLETLIQQTSIQAEPLSPQAALILFELNGSTAQFEQFRKMISVEDAYRHS